MEFFRDCTALITGASAGLGAEFARQLALDAGTLILVARRGERLEALAAKLTREHPRLNVHPYVLDLADDAAIDAFAQWVHDKNLRVNVLVNNAGLGDHGPFESSDWTRVKRILDVNISALTKLTHRLLPMLRAGRPAAILNVSSSAGFLPLPNMAVYAATKAYVTSFSEALRAELRGSGVSVTALCPGPIDTEFGAVANRGNGGMHAPAIMKITPERAVRSALRAVASDRARIIPGVAIWLTMALTAAVPMFLLRWLLARGAERIGIGGLDRPDRGGSDREMREVVSAGTFR